MAETLEQKVNQEKKEENKPVSTLESVLGEFKDLVNLGVAVAAPVAGYALTGGNLGVPVTSLAFIAGTKGRKDSKTIRNESLSASIFAAFAHYTRKPVDYITNFFGKLAYMTSWVLGANVFYMFEDHLVKKRTFKGLGTQFKQEYWTRIKNVYKYGPAAINTLAAIFLPQKYFLYTLALATYLFRRFVAKGEVKEYEDKRAYPVAALSVTSRLIGNPVKGFYEAVYSVASGVKDTLYKAAPPPAPPSPPAPAIAPA